MAGGTNIDAAAVGRAGTTYTGVAGALGVTGSALRDNLPSADGFGRAYRADGERCRSAITVLADAIDAWRDGSRAAGTGLTNSATAHRTTDRGGADAVTGAGRG